MEGGQPIYCYEWSWQCCSVKTLQRNKLFRGWRIIKGPQEKTWWPRLSCTSNLCWKLLSMEEEIELYFWGVIGKAGPISWNTAFPTTLPKKGSLHSPIRKLWSQILTDFKLAIRDPTDRGKQRTKATPSIPAIVNNIKSFLNQWKSVKYEGAQLIPEAGIDEINKLLVHVGKGCLSGIPLSGGTNHNEGMHRVLNKTLKKSRIGLQFALALLGVFFYTWNEISSMRDADTGKIRVTAPVESYFDPPECNDDTGFVGYVEPTDFNTEEHTETEILDTLYGHLNGDILVSPSDEENYEDDSFEQCENASSTEDCTLSEEEQSRMRDHSKVTEELFQHIKCMGQYEKFRPHTALFANSSLTLLNSSQLNDQESTALDDVLSNF